MIILGLNYGIRVFNIIFYWLFVNPLLMIFLAFSSCIRATLMCQSSTKLSRNLLIWLQSTGVGNSFHNLIILADKQTNKISELEYVSNHQVHMWSSNIHYYLSLIPYFYFISFHLVAGEASWWTWKHIDEEIS